MKNLKKSHKILIGSSAALLTLVPMVAVVATSCSNETTNSPQEQPNNPSVKPLPPPKPLEILVSTSADQVQMIVNSLSKTNSLVEIDKILNPSTLLTSLGLNKDFATVNYDSSLLADHIDFDVQLQGNYEFNLNLMHQNISGVVVTKKALKFSIPTDGAIVDDVHNYYFSIPKLESEIKTLGQIDTVSGYENVNSKTNNLYTILNMSPSDVEISASNGSPIVNPVDTIATKTLTFSIKNGKKFTLDFFNSLKSALSKYGVSALSLSNNDQTLTVANIPTDYVLEHKIQLNLSDDQLTQLKNYLTSLVNVHSATDFVNNVQTAIAKLLKIPSGYLTINLALNSNETSANKASSYDLTIAPTSGCEWENLNSNLLNSIFNKSNWNVSFANNVVKFTNIVSGIYNQSKSIGTINSSVLNADSLTSLTDNINNLVSNKQLISTLNKVLNKTAQLPTDAMFISAKPVSGNNNQVAITFANPNAKEFDVLNVNLTPANIDSTVFGNDTANITSALSDFSSAIVSNCVLNNTELNNEHISTSNFALNGTNAPVSQQDALESTSVANIMKAFSNISGVTQWVQREIMHYAYVEFSNLAGFANLGALSPTNSFATSTLSIQNKDGCLVANGMIGFELFNNTDDAVHIETNNSLLNNTNAITLNPGQYVAVSYNFNNSNIQPMFLNANQLNKVNLTYGFNNVTHHLVTFNSSENKYVDQMNTPSVTNLIGGLSNLMSVTLSNVSNTSNYYNPVTQKTFNDYLSSLTTDTIKTQLTDQDNFLWKFIQLAGNDAGQIFTVLGQDPTLGQFFNALSGPLTDVVSQLTGNKAFGQLIGDILSNKTVIQYWQANQAEIFKILSVLLNNPAFKSAINTVTSKINAKLPSGVQLPTLAAVSSNTTNNNSAGNKQPVATTPSESTNSNNQNFNLMNSVKELFLAYSKTADFKELVNKILAMVAHPTDSILNTQSLLQIIGEDLQPILQNLCDETKATQDNNPVWKLLNGLLQMIKTIETNQTTDTNNSIFNLRLFDIILNKNETDAIINFCKNGLDPFLTAADPSAVAPLNKAIGLMTKIFSGIQTLKLANPSNIFAAMSKIYVNGQKEPITWGEMFQKYISCTPTIDVKSYNPVTHTVTYNNVLKFSFTQTVSMNLQQIKQSLGNITVQSLCNAFGININQYLDKVPGIVWSWVISKKDILDIQVANLLPDTFAIQAGDGATCIMPVENVQLNPTVVNGQTTWWVNVPMIIKFNFKNSADKLINSIVNNVVSVLKPKVGWVWWRLVDNLILSAGTSVMNFANGYLQGQFNFSVGWVNRINSGNLQNYRVYDYNRNVENSNYKIIEKQQISNSEITKILTNPEYYKNLNTIEPDLQGQYVFNDDPALNQAIIGQLIDTAQTTWLTDPKLPTDMKPSVMVQFIPDNEFHLNLTLKIMGIPIPIHKNFNIPGKFIVSLKLPTPVPVSTNGGASYKMIDTITYSLPYAPVQNK